MKRDWDFLREQLTGIEEGRNVLADIPETVQWTDDIEWEEFERRSSEQRAIEQRIAGHLELLIDSGYVEGLTVLRGIDGHFSYSIHVPRLTMSGHDLLDTMRSATIWNSVKSTAKNKGIELTFEVIKALATSAVKHALG